MSEEKNNKQQNDLIPQEVLSSVFDDLDHLSGVNLDEDTRDLNEGEKDWPVFNWEEGNACWDAELTQFRFQEEEAEKQSAPPPVEVPPLSESVVYDFETGQVREQRPSMTLPESILAVMVYVGGVLLASFLIATVGWRWAGDVLALNKPQKTVSVTVAKGEDIDTLAQNLKEQGLIEYPTLFKTFAAVTHKADQITTGTYELSTEMDYSALLNSFRKTSAVRETTDITIPEGYTLEEVFQQLEQAGVCSAEDLKKSAEEDEFNYPFFQGVKRTGAARLEGYLFPDTYQFYKGTQAKSVLTKLLDNFQVRFDSVMQAQQQLSGYSTDEIVIMASIIEKETTGEDRNDISGVIYNRLNTPDHDDIDGRLQMDSTVQYILEERKAHLSNDDITIDNPYNTYVVKGLPVGPICNPGLESLRAALNPAKHEYFYFMLGNDGEDHFFKKKSKFEDFKAAQAEQADEVDEETATEENDE